MKIRILPNVIKKFEFWISVIALIVSALSWFDVHAQLRLMSGQVRSYVQVLDAKLVEPINDASFITIQLRLKNLGQTAATHVSGEMDYDLGGPDPNGQGNSATRRNFGSMGPGLERVVKIQSNRINRRDWPSPYPRQQSVYFFGTIWFTDDTTGEERKEDWCYELPLTSEANLKKVELDQCSFLTYESKSNRRLDP